MKPAAAESLRWSGVALILGAISTRALASVSELPGWDLDPSIIDAPISGVGPAASFWLDALTLLGAALALLGDALLGRRPAWPPLGLAVIGCFPIAYHGWLAGGGSLGDAHVGSAWAAAMLGAVALWHACRDAGPRRVVAAVVLGLAAVLVLKGAQQIFIEHPRTVADYRANRDIFLAAQGWLADSPMARAYERRLLQAEATGWFGLANVYATLCAASFVGLGTLAVGSALSIRIRRPAALIAPLATAVAAGAGVIMSGAKGGIIAAAAGIGAVLALVWLRHLRQRGVPTRTVATLGAVTAILAVAGPLLLVIIRGQLGEGALGGERSLLFRWFYLDAAARLFAEHPLAGVGPDGFQEAYQLAKNPLSTEDVRSPHSLLLDWVATLGIGALAWVGLWLSWLWIAATTATTEPVLTDQRSDDDLHTERRIALLVCAGATIAAAWLDRGNTTPDTAIVRFLGLAVWGVAAWGIVRLAQPSPALALALAGAALTAAAHGQIDVAGSWPQSAGLFLAIGACAGAAGGNRVSARPSLVALVPGVAAAALAVFVAVAAALPAQRWERDLIAAANDARPLARVNVLLGQVQSADPATRGRAQSGLLAELSSSLGRRIEPSGPAIEAALTELEIRAATAAAARLEQAAAHEPSDWRPRREASRMLVRAGTALLRAGRATDARRALDGAVEVLGGAASPAGAATSENRASAHLAWLAVIHRARHDAIRDPADLRSAAAALAAAAGRDPTNPDHAAKLAVIHRDLGDSEEARRWARRALELDALARLDPEGRGLGPERRETLRSLAGEP